MASIQSALIILVLIVSVAGTGHTGSLSDTNGAVAFLSSVDSLPTDDGPTEPGDSLSTDSLVADSARKTVTIKTKPFAHGSIVGWTTKPVVDRKRQSPGAAMLKSAFVPGWGQLGNRKYVKAVLVIGAETYLFLRWLDYRNQTVDARAAFESVEDDLVLRRQLFDEFDTVRDKRNFYAWLTGTLIFASMIDAFVDAHLAKFPAPEKKLSLQFSPPPSGSVADFGLGARVIWRF